LVIKYFEPKKIISSPETNSVSEALIDIRKTVTYLKSTLPSPQPGNVTLYNIVFNENLKMVVYFFKTDDILKSDLSNFEIENLKNEWRKNMLITMNNNAFSKSFVTAEISVFFILSDYKRNKIFEFVIRPEEYN
jgi:hypothetical protein